MRIEYSGKSNSSSGKWFVKLSDQRYFYFWTKAEMREFVESFYRGEVKPQEFKKLVSIVK